MTLPNSEATLMALLSASEDALIICDRGGRVVSVNPAAEALLGYANGELFGRSFSSLLSRPARQKAAEWLKDVVRQGRAGGLTKNETILQTKSGGQIPAIVTTAKAGKGGDTAVAIYLRAVGAPGGPVALAISREKLEQIIAVSEDAMNLVDRDLRIVAMNPASQRLFGYKAREIVGQSMGVLSPSRMRSTYAGRMQAFFTGDDVIYRRTVVDPVIMIRKDGTELYVDISATKFNVDGQVLVLAQLRDVSAAVDSAVLARSQARLAGIINLSEDAIITVDESHRITLFNPAAERIFGYKADEVLGQHMEMLIPPRLRQVHRQHVADFLELKDVHQLQRPEPIMALRKTGEEFPCESTVGKFELNGEQILTVRLRDITEKLKADTDLAMSERRLAGMVALSDHAIITVDKNNRITLFNPAAEQTFGYRETEVLGRSFEMLIPRRLRPLHRRHVQKFVESEDETRRMSLTAPILALRKNGEEFPAESAVAKFKLNDELVLTVRLRDVTERVKADEMRVELLAAEESSRLKMRLISTVSHELRSPLSAILGFTSLLIDYDERIDRAERLRQLRIIEDSTRHVQGIVDDLLALSRLEAGVLEIQREPVPLQTLFSAVLATFGAVTTHEISVVPRETKLVVIGDQSRLRQVLSNLIDNAIKYSPPGGEVELRARRMRGCVAITVRDYGPGVPPDETEVIFEAFYRGANATADERIKSTGLGLAICKGFVEAHGGEIEATLPEGGGLAVTVKLPLSDSVPAT